MRRCESVLSWGMLEQGPHRRYRSKADPCSYSLGLRRDLSEPADKVPLADAILVAIH